MSVIDTQAELRTKSKEDGKARYGIDVFKGKVADLSTRDIYEPLTVKNQVINSATEAACMILRIDNIISASAPKSEGPPPGGSLWRRARILSPIRPNMTLRLLNNLNLKIIQWEFALQMLCEQGNIELTIFHPLSGF